MHIEIVMFATNAKEIVLDAIMLMFNADTDIILTTNLAAVVCVCVCVSVCKI